MAFGIRIRLFEILIRIRLIPQRTALEPWQSPTMAVVEDRLIHTYRISISLPSRPVPQPHHRDRSPALSDAAQGAGTREERESREKEKKTYKILPVRRQIIRQPFPTQRIDDRVRRERAGALLAVRHERLARLRHPRHRVLGGRVLRFHEVVARDGSGVVVCVGFLEVFGAGGLALGLFFLGLGFGKGEGRGGRNGLGSMMVRGKVYIADEAGSLLLRSGWAFRLSVEQCRL